jgi:hypothetical protein
MVSEHERQMENNIALFKAQISEAKDDSTKLETSTKLIRLYNNYEDYIIKSRQANHTALLAYAPIVTAVASAVIALFLGLFTVYSYLRPSPTVDGIIQIIQASDKENIVSNLKAFQDAGLISLSQEKIDKLAKVSMKK